MNGKFVGDACYLFATESGMVIDYVPKEEVRRVLSTYLSEITVTDQDAGSELHLPEMNKPEGFHLIHKRCSRRSLYEISEAFAVILSEESSWEGDEKTRENRTSVCELVKLGPL